MREVILKDPELLVRHYDSMLDMVDHIRAAPRQWRNQHSWSEPASLGWDGAVGYDGALRLAYDGWPEGVRQIHALARLVHSGQLPTRGFDVAGEFPDVPRALGGDPRNMVTRGCRAAPKPVVTIAVGLQMSAGTTGKLAMNYGAALVGLIDRLESQGVRIELHATAAIEYGSAQVSVALCLKQAGDALDQSAIAFAIAHPAMFRRLMFAAWERTPSKWEFPSYGYPLKRMNKRHFIGLPENTIILTGVCGAIQESQTLEGAVKFLELQLNVSALENVAELEVL